MKFHVFYYCGGNGQIRSFDTDEARSKWVGDFTLVHLDDATDFSIAFTFDGDLKAINNTDVTVVPVKDSNHWPCRCEDCNARRA